MIELPKIPKCRIVIIKNMYAICLVEDDLELRRAIQFKLKREDFKVLAVTSGEEAFKILESCRVDLIWLDLLLPGMGGMQFLDLLRKNSKYRDTPVIIVSVLSDSDRIKKAFELNVVDYIVKSQAKLEDVVTKVKKFLA